MLIWNEIFPLIQMNFKALTLKIYQLICIDIRLRINWKNDFEIRIWSQQEEEDFANFIKLLAMLSCLSETNSTKISDMNKRFSFNVYWFIEEVKENGRLSNCYSTQELSILDKAVKKWKELFNHIDEMHGWCDRDDSSDECK